MSFIRTDDVRKRLGLASLGGTQTEQIDSVIGLVDGLILDAVGKDDAWMEALDPVPPMLRVIEMSVVCRAIANTTGAIHLSESLGQYSETSRWAEAAEAGLSLTDREERLARRAVFGSDVASPVAGSTAQDLEQAWVSGGGGLGLEFYPIITLDETIP